MITNIWFYSLFSAVVAVFCTVLFIKAYRSRANTAYLKLFSNLVAMNILQMVGYLLFSFSPNIAEYAADAYLISLYLLFVHLPLLALSLSKQGTPSWARYCYIVPLLMVILHLCGFMVESYRIEKNALMHNDGELAYIFDAIVIISCVLTGAIFWRNGQQCDDNLRASRNIIALISFVPLILASMVLVTLSMGEHAIPVVVVAPSVSLYIASVFYYISRSRVIDLSIGPAAFTKRVKLALLLLESLKTKSDLDTFNHQLRIQRYREAMIKHNNDFNAAADELKVHHTTLRNGLKEASD